MIGPLRGPETPYPAASGGRHPAPGASRPARVRRAPEPVADPLVFAVIGAMMIYVWRVQDLHPILGALQLPSLVSLLAFGLFVLDGDRRRKLRTIWSQPVIRVVTAIMCLAVASVPTSVHDGMSFRFILNDLGKNFVLMLIIAASVRSFADVRRYSFAMLLGAMWYAQYVYFNIEVGLSGRLGELAYYDANDLGMLLVCSIPLALFFLLRGTNAIVRLGALLSLPLFLLVIIMSGSRGAFLGFVAVGFYLLLFFDSVSKKARIIAVVASFVALTALGSEQYWGMMRTLLNPKDDYNWSGQSDSGRMDVWKRGVGYMLSRPLTGVGVFAFPVAEGTISELASRQDIGIGLKWSAAHNSFVQIGAELGIFGLCAFCMAIFYAYRSSQRSGRSPPSTGRRTSDARVLGQALGGAIVGFIVCGFFLSQAYAAFTFVLYGLVVGLAKVEETDTRPVTAKRRRRVQSASIGEMSRRGISTHISGPPPIHRSGLTQSE
jgi:O-antigen ligase